MLGLLFLQLPGLHYWNLDYPSVEDYFHPQKGMLLASDRSRDSVNLANRVETVDVTIARQMLGRKQWLMHILSASMPQLQRRLLQA